MTPEMALTMAEKEQKGLYLKACLERRRTFTPMVYSADGIPGAEALATQKRLAALLSYKLSSVDDLFCAAKASAPGILSAEYTIGVKVLLLSR